MDIWQAVDGKAHIKPLIANIHRLVESQEQIATLSLADDIYAQGILEELLETSKAPDEYRHSNLHYLLKTPFRYPPLTYGSRFGSTYEQGIFYASMHISTALAETAYYRFVFMAGPEIPYEHVISSEYTAFTIAVKTEKAMLLDQWPFDAYEAILTSPISYQATQTLGSNMRQHEVSLFRYISARDKSKGKNIGVFTPDVFCKQKPSHLTQWLCQSKFQEVGFISLEDNSRFLFKQEDFWEDGKFPSPAV